MKERNLTTHSSNTEVAEFLNKAKQLAIKKQNQGRLIFALDATASRQSTWDQACQLQGEMFIEAAAVGSLDIQLVWYRGFAEFAAAPWANQADQLLRHMSKVQCVGGMTQITRVLSHAVQISRQQRVNALVFVGDCVEESPEELYDMAGQLGILSLPVFAFHEGADPHASQILQRIAKLSRGAYCSFDAGSARQLKELLKAVAVYAAGGKQALHELSRLRGGLVRQLSHQLS